MNFNRLLISTVICASLLGCGGAEERKSVYLDKAKTSIEIGDLDKARIELKNVTQMDPKDSEAIYLLGTVFEKQGDLRKAYSQYLRVEELNPDNLTNQAKLGMFNLIYANDVEKAQEKIDYILSRDLEYTDGLLLKAAIMLKKNDIDGALKIAESANSKDSGHVNTAVFLTSLYIKKEEFNKAVSVIEKALKVNADNEQLNRVLALVLMNNKEYDKAEQIYLDFLAKHPDNASSFNNLAAFYNQSSDKEKAKETLKSSIDNDPDDVDRYLTYIKYINTIYGKDVAIDELKSFIAAKPGLAKLRNAIGELYILSNQKENAISAYKSAIADFPEEGAGVEARISLAAIYLSEGNYEEGSKIVDEAMSVSPNDPKVNFLRAKLAMRDKDIESAIISLRVVTKETPENIDAFLLLSKAYSEENNTEQVRATLNNAYENNKNNAEALLKLAQFYLSRDADKSEEIIDDYNRLKESDYDGLSIKAALLNQKQQLSEAADIANKLIEAFPDKPNGYLQIIPHLNKTSQLEKAISVLENGYLNVKDNKKILVLLTTLQVSQKKYDIAEKRLAAEIKSSPDDVQYHILLSKVYIAKNDSAAAIDKLKEIISTHPGNEEVYLLLTKVYESQMKINDMVSVLEKGRQNIEASMRIPLRLASVYEYDKKYNEAINIYRELYEKNPDNLIIANNLASMLSDHSVEDKDLELARQIAVKLNDSDQPVFLDTVGWVYYKSADYASAIKYLSKVVEKAPQINVFNYHLGMAYKMSGDKVNAKIFLEKSLENANDFKEKAIAEEALNNL